ncbi:hypothetical protein HY490_05005 [Candidatus Woesearchaeota archaeon]|nr:hypothetical protein [Candidatus Woesearchaeota archaeon]
MKFAVAAVVLVLILPAIRLIAEEPVLVGNTPYFHMRVAQEWWRQGFVVEDFTVSGGRLVVLTPYHALLAAVGFLTGDVWAMMVLSAALTVASVIVLSRIVRGISAHLHGYFMGLYVVSMPVLMGVASPGPAAWSVLLLLIGIWAFIREWTRVSSLAFVLLSLQGANENILALAGLVFLSRAKGQELTGVFFFLISLLLGVNLPVLLFYQSPSDLSPVIAEFGGVGMSAFMLVLAAMGVLFIWRYKSKQYSLYVCCLLFFAWSLYDNRLLPFSNFFVVFLAAHTVHALITMKFVLRRLKPVFTVIVAAGVLVQPVFLFVDGSRMKPDNSLFMIGGSAPSAVVFSTSDTGFLLEYAGARAVIDPLESRYAHGSRVKTLVDRALTAVEIPEIREALRALGATHVLLTPEMAENHPRFAQLMANGESFKSLGHRKGYALYAVRP